MSRPFSFVKVTLLILNVFFLILGAILIAVGAFSLKNLSDVSVLLNTGLPIGIIILGTFIFILSFFGCCGAAIENRFLLIIYVIILLVLMICQIAIGGAAYSQRQHVSENLKYQWSTLDNDTQDWVEDQFLCCGFDSIDEDQACVDRTGHQDACGVILIEFFSTWMTIIFYIGIIFGLIEIAGLVFGLLLYCCISAKGKADTRERLLS